MDMLNLPLIFLMLVALFGFLFLIGIAIHWLVFERSEPHRGPIPHRQKETKISPIPPLQGAASAPSTSFDAWHAAKYGGTFKEMHQRGFDIVADSQMLLMERIKEYVSETCQGDCRPACGYPVPPDERDLFDAWFAGEFSNKPRRNNRGYKSQQVAHMYKAWKAAKGME